MATGTQRRRPGIAGLDAFDGAGVSYCAVCDGFFCRGKQVAVLGAGAYALHEAGVLLPLAGQVTLLTNGESAPDALPQGLQVDVRPVEALEGKKGFYLPFGLPAGNLWRSAACCGVGHRRQRRPGPKGGASDGAWKDCGG
mgnify:CR=1 FL=1